MGLVGQLLRSLAAHYHSVCGWSAYRLGWVTSARRHYERVLVLRSSDFSAYVHLGRISFAQGDYAGWRREFEHARRTDPQRFARLRHPFELFEPRLAGTDFDETGERATWRSLRPFGGTGKKRSPRQDLPRPHSLDQFLPAWDVHTDADPAAEHSRAGDQGTSDPDRPQPENAAEAGSSTRDDCASSAERRRFRDLGPIAAADVAKCDLDDLLRRLSG